MSFPGGLMNLPANAGDMCSSPGSGRSPGEGKGNPLQCSCLGIPMDRGARIGPDLMTKQRTIQGMDLGLPRWLSGEEPVCQCRRRRRCKLDPWVRKEMASHSRILAWKSPLAEEPGGLRSIGITRSRTQLSYSTHPRPPV